ncbi:MAG: hypothetical protein U0271_19745 [Polyangiaceae bacterium]
MLRRIACCCALASLAWGCAGSDEPRAIDAPELEPAALEARLVKDLAAGKSGARCAYKTLGKAGSERYLWVLCQTYEGGRVTWAVSEPVVVEVDPSAAAVTEIRVPGDGDRYEVDVARMFPEELQSTVLQRDAEEANRRVHALEAELASP